MAWTKTPPALEELLDRIAITIPAAEKRKMFGFPVYFLRGNMLIGTFEDTLFLRLSAADRATMIEQHDAAQFSPMPGRPMQEYIVLPPAILADEPNLLQWLQRGAEYVMTLPQKEKKVPAKRPRGS